MKKKIVIAIDGPAGAGKSTLGKKLADYFGLLYIDSGAMYRAFTLKCLNLNISLDDKDKIAEALATTDIKLKQSTVKLRVYLDNEDVTEEIRSYEVSRSVSAYSAIPAVRERMISLQRQMGDQRSVVMDGRDIGTVVFPNADLKIFLDASTKTRAMRRYKETKEYDIKLDLKSKEFQSLLNDQVIRDKTDRERKKSPLKPANDAMIIDSSEMSIEDVLDSAVELVKKITE